MTKDDRMSDERFVLMAGLFFLLISFGLLIYDMMTNVLPLLLMIVDVIVLVFSIYIVMRTRDAMSPDGRFAMIKVKIGVRFILRKNLPDDLYEAKYGKRPNTK